MNVCAPGLCCGNGTLEPGETCDDGNQTGGDCCSATCTAEPAGTACSDGNACTAVDLCAVSPAANLQSFDGATVPGLSAEWATAVTPATVSDKVLDRDPFVARPGSVLEFDNRYNLESTFDGAVLEIRIGAGAFTDIVTAGGSFVVGGYNSLISASFSSPIAGRAAWSGASAGFVHTKVNLPAAAEGQTVTLRFRVASDASLAATAPNGQWIDNVQISGNASSCQPGGPAGCDDENVCTTDSCDPGSGCVNTLPSAPVGSPVLTETKLGGAVFTVSWNALPGATRYDMVYGALESLRSTNGDYQLSTLTCLFNDHDGLEWALGGDPGPGQGFWLLVRGENCGGNGTYDGGPPWQVGLRDAGIAASGNGCP